MFILGLVVGAVIGAAAIYFLTRQSAPAGPAAPSVAAERALKPPMAEPPAPAPAPPPPDDDVQHALDASKGLIDELEGRYRDRPAPPPDEEPGEPKPRRRPRPKA
jgi:hypothetical protein